MDPEQIIRNFLALFHTAKLDGAALRNMLADNARYQPIVPVAPVRTGADEIVAELERQYRLYDECECKTLNVAVSGNVVFTERVDSVRQIVTGQRTTTAVAGIFDLEPNGKIAWWREYWDALDCAGQLGIDDRTMRSILIPAPSNATD